MDYMTTGYVTEKHWGPDDDYLVVEVQVPSTQFSNGERVKVEVIKITDKL